MPALRERPEDIVPLARHFASLHGARDAKPWVRLSPSAEARLLRHDWPGNVRELENAIARAVALAEPGAAIPPELFASRPRLQPAPDAPDAATGPATTDDDSGPLRTRVDGFERSAIRRALARHAGHRTRTARELGLTREGLYKKMKRLGIE